ncbi:hypothetical protein TNCV_4085121 [Trichonephila clavipes]|nr:hypothetical protein TNCV_4085121 [Trichonephila clavipes]
MYYSVWSILESSACKKLWTCKAIASAGMGYRLKTRRGRLEPENMASGVFQDKQSESDTPLEKLRTLCRTVTEDRLLCEPWQELLLKVLEGVKCVSVVFQNGERESEIEF